MLLVLFRSQHWIALHVDPVCFLRRNVAAKTVLFVVSCNLLIRRVPIEECPTSSISPHRIAGVATFAVFDHYEPNLPSRSPMGVARRQLTVIAAEDFFDQHSAIGKLSILAVVLSGTWRRVRVVHLDVAIQISD